MAIQTIEFKRGAYNYTLHIGTDSSGQAVDYIDRVELDETEHLPVRYYPDEIRIKRDVEQGKGAVKYVETTYIKSFINPVGNPTGIKEYITFRTNDSDVLFFIAGLGVNIMKSSTNGFFRGPMGFNNLRIFDSITGTVLTYTPEQIAANPTFDYYG
jgi:hypothetical protein